MTDHVLVQRWRDITSGLTDKTKLIAVSKYTSNEKVEQLIHAGQQDFGESRPQNLRDRATLYPQAHWHMIGPLQKNKAKYVAKHAYMWHSLCDIETAQAVAKHVEGRVLPVLIQVNISGESQKQGVVPQALGALYEELAHIKAFQVVGLMGMAAKDVDAQPAFALLRECGKELESSCSPAA
ncbi:MAG: alanine racemase, partial [Ghiorsea sp.]